MLFYRLDIYVSFLCLPMKISGKISKIKIKTDAAFVLVAIVLLLICGTYVLSTFGLDPWNVFLATTLPICIILLYSTFLKIKRNKLFSKEFELGNVFFNDRKYEKALEHFENALKIMPGHATTWYNYALCKSFCHDYFGSVNGFTQVINIEPEYSSAYFGRGVGYDAIDDFRDELDLNESILQLKNERSDKVSDVLSEALKDFNIYLNSSNDDPIARFYRGKVFFKKEQYLEAIVDLESALLNNELTKGREEVYFYLEMSYRETGMIAKALKMNQKALEINPVHIPSLINKANYLGNDPDSFEDALDIFYEIIKIEPDYAPVYFEIGKLYFNHDLAEDSLPYLNQAIDLEEEFINARFLRGIVYRQLDYYKESLVDFNFILEHNPELAEAYLWRSTVKDLLEDPEGALDDYNRALELNPDLENEDY